MSREVTKEANRVNCSTRALKWEGKLEANPIPTSLPDDQHVIVDHNLSLKAMFSSVLLEAVDDNVELKGI